VRSQRVDVGDGGTDQAARLRMTIDRRDVPKFPADASDVEAEFLRERTDLDLGGIVLVQERDSGVDDRLSERRERGELRGCHVVHAQRPKARQRSRRRPRAEHRAVQATSVTASHGLRCLHRRARVHVEEQRHVNDRKERKACKAGIRMRTHAPPCKLGEELFELPSLQFASCGEARGELGASVAVGQSSAACLPSVGGCRGDHLHDPRIEPRCHGVIRGGGREAWQGVAPQHASCTLEAQQVRRIEEVRRGVRAV